MQVAPFPFIGYVPQGVEAVKRTDGLFSRLAADPDLPGELLPGQSLVELTGDNRVLIENHRGVVEYSRCRIGIAVGFGLLQVCGHCLELARMTREMLVITGQVERIELVRRDAT